MQRIDMVYTNNMVTLKILCFLAFFKLLTIVQNRQLRSVETNASHK